MSEKEKGGFEMTTPEPGLRERLLAAAVGEDELFSTVSNALLREAAEALPGGWMPVGFLHPIDYAAVQDNATDGEGYVCRIFPRRGEIGVPIFGAPSPTPPQEAK